MPASAPYQHVQTKRRAFRTPPLASAFRIITSIIVRTNAGQGSITAPGCIAATPVDTPIDVTEGYPLEVPLVYYYGHVSPSENPELYRFQVERLAGALNRRMQESAEARTAGRYPGAPTLDLPPTQGPMPAEAKSSGLHH